MAKSEVHLELLIGKKVVAENGHVIGRIEEVEAEKVGRRLLVVAFHIGAYAALERFSASGIGRALLKAAGISHTGYRIPWNRLDILKDPPELLCKVKELEPLG